MRWRMSFFTKGIKDKSGKYESKEKNNDTQSKNYIIIFKIG